MSADEAQVHEPVVDVVRELAEERRRDLRRSLVDIDNSVRRYHRKRAGLEPWTDFAELLPPSVREHLEKAA